MGGQELTSGGGSTAMREMAHAGPCMMTWTWIFTTPCMGSWVYIQHVSGNGREYNASAARSAV